MQINIDEIINNGYDLTDINMIMNEVKENLMMGEEGAEKKNIIEDFIDCINMQI